MIVHVALVHNHVGGKAGGGGGVRLMLELGAELTKLGHRVTIACHDYQPGAEFSDVSETLDIRAVRHGVSEWVDSRAKMISRFWVDMPKVARLVPDDVDVVNAHEWPGLHAGRLAARRLRAPLVWTRNDEAGWERAIVPEHTIVSSHRPLTRLMRGAIGWPDLLDARRADAIVVLAQLQAEMVWRSYRKRATCVPLGPPAQFFSPPERSAARRRLGVADDTFLVVSAAILFPHRRFEDLIDALALVPDPSVKALIVGSDHGDRAYADTLSDLIERRELSDRVTLPRRAVSDDEMRDAYAAADVFVWPNQRQTWGLAPLEALAAGTPAIVSSGAGVHEILVERGGVQIVEPERPEQIAEAIVRAKDGAGRDGLEQTRAWLRDELTSRRYAERMVEVYDAALGAGANGRPSPRA